MLWDLDSIGIRVSDEVHETFENEISFNNNIYLVTLPWKQGHYPSPLKLCQQFSAHAKPIKEIAQRAGSVGRLCLQLKSGVIESVPALEKQSERLHYLHHQAVIRKGAERTKLRIVYDASAKERKNGPSLNDCLHTGPSLNPLLFDILV